MNRVVHFEIHASDPEKIGGFYSEVFGWEIKEWEMPGVSEENRYWFVLTAPEGSQELGINGGMVVRRGELPQEGVPVSSFVCTISVENVDEYLERVKSAGGTVAVPKMAIPNTAWLAYAKDPEGNTFGLYQEDSSAI